jgi:hypothetical protein
LKQVAQLVEDIQRLQATVSKLRDIASSQTARLEEELASKSRALEILQEKMSAQSDYDEIKRELRYDYWTACEPHKATDASFLSVAVSLLYLTSVISV